MIDKYATKIIIQVISKSYLQIKRLSLALIPRQSFTSSVTFINATHQSHMRGCMKCMRIATSSKQHMKRGSETKGLYVILVRKDYKTSHVQLVNIIRNCIY